MRFQLDSTVRAKRVAKELLEAARSRGVELRHSASLELVARMYGYETYSALMRLAGRGRRDDDDRFSSQEEVASRRIAHVGVLVSAGFNEAVAVEIVDAIRPTGRMTRLSRAMLVPSSRRRYGAAILENPRVAKGIWWSVDGGPASRVETASELDPSITWWTNAFHYAFYSATNLSTIPNLRPEKFLGVSQSQVMGEASLLCPKPEHVASVCSEFLSNVMEMAEGLLEGGEIRNGVDMYLFENFGRILNLSQPSPLPHPPHSSCFGPYESFVITTSKLREGARNLSLGCDLHRHAGAVAKQYVPTGRVRKAEGLDAGERDLRSVDHDSLPEGAPSMLGRGWQIQRKTDRGLLVTAGAHRILKEPLNILSSYTADEWERPIDMLPEAIRNFIEDTRLEGNFPAGIVAMNVVKGVKRRLGGWVSEWMSARSHELLLRSAMDMSEAGFLVPYFGDGWLTVNIDESEFDQAVRTGEGLGLVRRWVPSRLAFS